ncbi:MAG: PAS domain S-box protein [Ignavibacteriae bacterium]|nr:PAS domain S-box protein [Ignavibacteriota bacterium]
MQRKKFFQGKSDHYKTSDILLNSKFEILNIDKKTNSLIGFEKSEIAGKSFHTILEKSEQIKLKTILAKFLSNKKNQINFETIFIKKDNSKIWVKICGTKLKYNTETQISFTVNDITKEKKYDSLILELHKCSQNFTSDSKQNVKNTLSTLSRIFNTEFILFAKSSGEVIYNFTKLHDKNSQKYFEEIITIACSPKIRNQKNNLIYISDLSKLDINNSNKFIKSNNIKSYLGKIVRSDKKVLGILCAFFKNDFIPDKIDLQILDILSTTFAVEETKIIAQNTSIENELRFKSLFDNSTIGIYRSTPAGKIVFANPKFISLLGYDSLKDLQKIDINKELYLNPKNRNEFRKILESEDTIHGYLENLKRKNGSIVNIRESSRVVKNEQTGKILYYEGTIEDISIQRKIENALIESEEKFRSIFQSSGFGICIVNADKKFTDVNPKFCEIFGYTKDELLSKTFIDITHPDFIKSSSQIVKELFLGIHKQVRIEKKYIRKDGKEIWGSITINLMHDNSNGKTNLLGIAEDITERINFINELKAKDEILSALSFSTETFLKTLDWQANINEVLKRLSESLKVKRSYVYQNSVTKNGEITFSLKYEWVDRNVKAEINNPAYKNFSYKKFNLKNLYEALSKNEIFVINTNNISQNEKNYLNIKEDKSIITVPIYESESLWGFMGFEDFNCFRIWSNQEIDAIKTAGNLFGVAIKRKIFEEDLLKAKINAEESEKLKSQFLAQISHEIRSPINSILSFSNLLKEEIDGNINSELQSSFEIIESAGNRITRTIDLILNMSEIQTNTYEYIPRKIDIYEEILIPLVTEFKGVAISKGIKFQLIKKSENNIIVLDPYTVMQIFANLLDNAFKYTNKGNVKIKINKNRKGNIIVEVSDTGIGISAKYLPKLFKPFSQEEQGYTRKFEGNGLGLALVKNYCDLNNAEISVTSKKNIGTTFKVCFN